jgi:hypothetical protein
MKLTPPTQITFWISVVLGLLGLLIHLGAIGEIGIEAFWLVFAGFALHTLSVMVEDL